MANPAYRKTLCALTAQTVNGTPLALVAETDANGGRGPYGFIHGVARATNAVTITIYWGHASGTYEGSTVFLVPAGASSGAGLTIDRQPIAAQYFKIEAVETATGVPSADFRCGLYMTAY